MNFLVLSTVNAYFALLVLILTFNKDFCINIRRVVPYTYSSYYTYLDIISVSVSVFNVKQESSSKKRIFLQFYSVHSRRPMPPKRNLEVYASLTLSPLKKCCPLPLIYVI
jgi:hypothetical protein